MQGDEDKLGAHAKDVGGAAEHRAEEGPASEIPTDPSCPSHPSESGAHAAPETSHASSSLRRRSGPTSLPRERRTATSLDRAPRSKKEREAIANLKTESEAAQPAEEAASRPPDVKDEHVGKVFGGKYRIDKLVAKGGMGRVYRGMQFPLERPVAIKILNKEFQRTDPQFVRRFFLEAATAAKLSHPHTITVFDYGEADNGELYIAMEYLRGRPLSRVITNDGPFPAARALRVSIQVCRAVREAHHLGIIHRDLKPGNIFLVDEGDEGDYAKVLDFGLVKLFRPEHDGQKHEAGMLGEGDPELTRTGTLLGSPKYMSPEQIQGHHLDPRTDIYSFGVILFQMIAAKPPYTGATGVDVIYKHVHAPVPTIQTVAPDVECPAVVEAIITKCLSKKRDDRYASMDELIGELKEASRMISGVAVSTDSIAEIDTSRADSLRARVRATSKTEPKAIPAIQPVEPSHSGAREARFKDHLIEEPTPIGQLAAERSGDVSSATVRPSRAPLYVAASGFVVALATLLWVTVISPKVAEPPKPPQLAATAGEPARAPAQPAAPVDVELAFTSEPPGAHVFDGETELGVTPFKATLGKAAEPRALVFRYSGYKDAVKNVVLDGSVAAVAATLEPVQVAVEADPGKDDEKRSRRRRGGPKAAKKDNGPYRQNPY